MPWGDGSAGELSFLEGPQCRMGLCPQVLVSVGNMGYFPLLMQEKNSLISEREIQLFHRDLWGSAEQAELGSSLLPHNPGPGKTVPFPKRGCHFKVTAAHSPTMCQNHSKHGPCALLPTWQQSGCHCCPTLQSGSTEGWDPRSEPRSPTRKSIIQHCTQPHKNNSSLQICGPQMPSKRPGTLTDSGSRRQRLSSPSWCPVDPDFFKSKKRISCLPAQGSCLQNHHITDWVAGGHCHVSSVPCQESNLGKHLLRPRSPGTLTAGFDQLFGFSYPETETILERSHLSP